MGCPIVLSSPTQFRGALLTSLVCVIWAALAIRSPTLTYHFAPIIAGVLWPLSLRTAGRRTAHDAWSGGAGAAVLVVVSAAVLHFGGWLEGPTFWNEGPSISEAVLFGLAGAMLGARSASRQRPGLLGSIVQRQAE
jgi:hypothetical protein